VPVVRPTVLGLAVASVLSCGSTVPMGDVGAAGPSTVAGDPVMADPASGPGSAPSMRPTRSAEGMSKRPRAEEHARPATIASDRCRTAASLPGVTSHFVAVGIWYVDAGSLNAASKSFGAAGTPGGADQLAYQRAIAAYINNTGGLVCGRRIKLVEHQFNLANDYATEFQAMCSDFTEDHHVAAAISATADSQSTGALVACLARRGALAIGSAYNVGDEAAFARYRGAYYTPASLELSTAARIYGQGLVRAEFFDSRAKLGILAYEGPEFDSALARGLLPELARSGVRPIDVVRIAPPAAFSGQGRLVADVQNAVLRFQTHGITHVLFLDGGSSLAYFFIQQADSQGFTPRYGLSSASVPSFLEQNFGSEQLHDAVGVGWVPTYDVAAVRLPPNPARALCQRIMDEAGLTQAVEANLSLQLGYCSQLFFLRAALNRSVTLSQSGVAAGLAWRPTMAESAAFGDSPDYFDVPSRTWGTNTYRLLAYSDACSCFRYTTDRLPV
jgi:hypothetical protein